MAIDWSTIAVAGYAAIVATAALALEVRRWFESGPRLHVSLMPVGRLVGDDDDEADYLVANVTNRGSSPTTITTFGLMDYETRLSWLRRKPRWHGFAPRPELPGSTPSLPKFLQPGERWTGVVKYNEDLAKRRDLGFLYVGIYASHSGKPAVARLRMSNMPPQPER